MCGIAGIWSKTERSSSELRDIVAAMGEAITHRGPDGAGIWVAPSQEAAFVHRRLSILDLSEAGSQPMRSPSGRYTLTYNGEVYNFRALREELSGDVEFRGHSDTEVLIAAIECWGVHRTVKKLNGMFAFAVWDEAERTLTIARDRLGIKPLYVGEHGDALRFCSDLGSIRAVGGTPEIDRDALAGYFRYGCFPDQTAVFEGYRKVTPGTVLTFRSPDLSQAEEHVYWSAHEVASRGPRLTTSRDAVDQLEAAIRRSVERRLVADVPVGAFLSGGVDSSTIVALMAAVSSKPVHTFSIGFHEAEYDEAVHAREVANHLGTKHTEMKVTPDDLLGVVPDLGRIYGEPFADSSQVPTVLVSRLAREHVTVALSGDGGDELFGGYNRHLWAPRVWGVAGKLPNMARGKLGAALASRSPSEWRDLFGKLPGKERIRVPGEKLHKLAGVLSSPSADDLYLRLTSIWQDPKHLVLGSRDYRPDFSGEPESWNFAERMMFRDLVGYLPHDILTKVDRASMSIGLEARVPLLDHELVELAWQLPHDVKIRDGVGKWALREVLFRHVPRELIERPKMGFGVPIADWLRGPLRTWASDLLDQERLRKDGLLSPSMVQARWEEHLSGRRDWHHQLWAVLMLQQYLHS